MTDRHSKNPDERWDAVGKDQTRETHSGVDKNTRKPDDARAKDEITDGRHGPAEDEVEED